MVRKSGAAASGLTGTQSIERALSLLCGLASSLGALLGARVLLGLFGGPIMPLIVLFGLNAVDEFDRTAFAARYVTAHDLVVDGGITAKYA